MTGRFPVCAAWRQTRAMAWRVFAVMLILGAGFGMYAGVYSAIDSLFDFRDRLYQRADIAALELRFSPEDAINVPAVKDLPGIRDAQLRLLLPGHITIAGDRPLSALLVASDGPPRINRLLLEQGEELDPNHPYEVVIDRNLARHYGYTVGDQLTLNIGRDRFTLTVRGIAVSAEHLVDGADPSFFLPAKGSLGIVFASLTLMKDRAGFTLVNSLLVTGPTPATDLPDTSAQALNQRLQQKLTVEERIPLSKQFGHLFLNVDLNAFRIFTPAIVVIFALSGVTILFFLLHQWVSQQRRELGLCLALGYGPRIVVKRLLGPLALIAAGGIGAGLGIAYLMLYGFGHEYATAIGLPAPDLALMPSHVLTAVGGLLALCLLAVWRPLRQAMQVTPQQAVRDVHQFISPPSANPVQRINNTIVRYAWRAVLRRPRVSFMTLIAIALALAPALSYFIALTSFKQAIVDSFATDRWTYSVDFLAPVWDDELGELARLPGVQAVDPIVRGAIRFKAGEREESGLLTGVLPESSLRHPRVIEGRPLRKNETEGVLMERRLARTLGLAVGDTLSVEGPRAGYDARLIGIFSGALPGEAFTTRESARIWLDLEEQNTGVLLTADASLSTNLLYGTTRVGKVTTREVLVAEVLTHLNEIAGIVYLAAVFSIAVALLFLYTSTAFTFMEREADFVLLNTLGFSPRTVAAMVRVELGTLGVIGVLLSVPLGIVLAQWLNGILSKAWFQVPTTVATSDVLSIVVPALLLLPLIALPLIKRLRAQHMTSALRQRSFG